MEHEFGVGDPDVVIDAETFIAASEGSELGREGDDSAPAAPIDLDIDGSVLDTIEQELADVERALVLLDEGTYGQCEACGATIDDAVLARAPAARFCADHLPLALR